MMAQLQREDKVSLNAKKFNMWIFVFTSAMLFLAFSSAFIVYTGSGRNRQLNMTLPSVFVYSSLVIVMSSVTMWLASRAAKQLDFSKQRLFLWLTFGLGIVFMVLQFEAWMTLISQQIYFINPNASRSFIYVFTFVHLLHILIGLLLILNTIVVSVRNRPQVYIQFKTQTTSIFWHFVGLLWIYLYIFLLLNQH